MFRKGDEPIPGYRLEQFLGKGQFGEVWRTTSPGGTSAALKFIDLGGKQGVKEFRGVQRVKEIRHANLMPITALWMLDGEGNILSNKAMESYDPEMPAARATLMVADTTNDVRPEWLVVAMLLGKKNLMDRLSECASAGQEGIPPDELLRYMEEAAKGIDYLNSPQHDLGDGLVAVQHCDIKPANIMLIGDAAVVCDFGLARVLTDAAGVTATGMVGSPAYMAPECIRRKPGLGSDQYSLAVSYVELRSGHLPFKELTYVEVLEANRQAKLDLSRLPPAEQQVIRRATSLKPDDRYPSALAMVHGMRRAVEGTPVPQTTWTRPLLAISTMLAMLIVLGGGLAYQYGWRQSGNANGHGKPVIVPNKTYTLTFDPPNVSVTLNGAAQTLTGGSLSAVLAADESVSIEAKGSEEYLPFNKQYSLDELKRVGYRIQLAPNGEYFAQRADELMAKGDVSGAQAAYQKAVRADAKFEQPDPIRLTQHTKPVQSLAISPDNKWLVSVGDSGQACLWPLEKARDKPTPLVLRGHAETEPIETVAISGDSHWLVTGSWDQTGIVWDLTANDPAATAVKLTGHQGDVVATAIASGTPPHPNWIVTAGGTTVRLWPIVDGKPRTDARVLEGHENGIDDICVGVDGRWLVSVDSGGNMCLWDLWLPNPKDSMRSLGKVSHRRHGLQLTPDSKWLIVAIDSNNGVFQVHAMDGKQPLRSYQCAPDTLESVAIDRSGQTLLVGDTQGNIVRYELTSDGAAKNPSKLGAQVGACYPIAIAPNGLFCVTGSFNAARLWALSAAGKQSAGSLSLATNNGKVTALAVSADNKWIATATDDGAVLLWDSVRCQLIIGATGGDRPQTKATFESTRRIDRREQR